MIFFFVFVCDRVIFPLHFHASVWLLPSGKEVLLLLCRFCGQWGTGFGLRVGKGSCTVTHPVAMSAFMSGG